MYLAVTSAVMLQCSQPELLSVAVTNLKLHHRACRIWQVETSLSHFTLILCILERLTTDIAKNLYRLNYRGI